MFSFDRDSLGRSRNDSLEENSSNFPDYFNECVKKEAITPPNSNKSSNNNQQNNNNNNNNNNNETDGNTSILHLKTEPIGNPDSPESSNDHPPSSPDECAGCGRLIQVRRQNEMNVFGTLLVERVEFESALSQSI